MATLSLSGISAALNLIFGEGMTAQMRRDVVALNLLEVVPGGNDTCTFRAKFDGRSAGGAFSEGADMEDSDFDSDVRLAGSLNWAQYRTGAKVSGLARSVDMANGGTGTAMGGILTDELRDAVDVLAVKIGTHVYSGNHAASPPQLAGAALAIDSSDDNFAGIDTGVYTSWNSAENSIASEDLSISNIRAELFRPIRDNCGREPEFCTTTGAIIDQIKDLIGERADVVNEVFVRARGKVEIRAITGSRVVVVDGVPFIEDRHCTANTIYGWHSDYVKLAQIPDADAMAPLPEVQAAVKALTGVEIPLDLLEQELKMRAQGRRLMPTIVALDRTGDSVKFMVKAYCQLKWLRRNAFGKLVLT